MKITRRIEFDAGHRVLGHEGKCANLHGHRYVAEVTVSSFGLDEIGRVVDFSVIKETIGGWIADNWDHNLLLNEDDPLTMANAAMHDSGRDDWLPRNKEGAIQHLFGREPYLMKGNPTAENMAKELFEITCDLFESAPCVVEMVRIYETPNCWSDYHGS